MKSGKESDAAGAESEIEPIPLILNYDSAFPRGKTSYPAPSLFTTYTFILRILSCNSKDLLHREAGISFYGLNKATGFDFTIVDIHLQGRFLETVKNYV